MTSLTKNGTPQAKKFFIECRLEDCRIFCDFYRVCRACRTREIPAQSHVRLGVFFSENPQTLADAKELSKIDTIINIMYIYIIDISI